MELLVFRVAHDEAVVGVPQDEGLGDGLDRVAEADVGGLRPLDQPHLLGHVDGDADEVRLAGVAVDQLGAGAEPDPAAVGVTHAEHAVDGGLALVVEGLGERHEVAVVGMDEAGDLAEAEQVVALVLADDLEHRARPEHAAPREVPVPQAAAAAHQRGLEALVGFRIDRVGLDGAARLGEVAVEDDKQNGAGADKDRDVERNVGPPVVEDACDRHDDGDGAGAAGDVVDRCQRQTLVGKGDLEDAGPLAEDGERLRLAEDLGERDAFAVEIARGGSDDHAVGIGDIDAAAVAGCPGGSASASALRNSIVDGRSPFPASASDPVRTEATRPMVSRASYSRSVRSW